MLTYTVFQRIKSYRTQCKLSAGVRISNCILFCRGTKVVYNLKRNCLKHVCRSRNCTRLLLIMHLEASTNYTYCKYVIVSMVVLSYTAIHMKYIKYIFHYCWSM
jgi:hypothetical protein